MPPPRPRFLRARPPASPEPGPSWCGQDQTPWYDWAAYLLWMQIRKDLDTAAVQMHQVVHVTRRRALMRVHAYSFYQKNLWFSQ